MTRYEIGECIDYADTRGNGQWSRGVVVGFFHQSIRVRAMDTGLVRPILPHNVRKRK